MGSAENVHQTTVLEHRVHSYVWDSGLKVLAKRDSGHSLVESLLWLDGQESIENVDEIYLRERCGP